jgi:hypothetical protein
MMDHIEPLIDFFMENMPQCIGGAILALIVLFFTRRYAFPMIFFLLQYALCLVVMHGGTGGFVRMVSWFKAATAMKTLKKDTIESADPGWTTPFIEFWDKSLYDPEWIAYVEIGFAVVIFGLLVYFRGPVVKRRKKAKIPKGKGKGKDGSMLASSMFEKGTPPKPKKDEK